MYPGISLPSDVIIEGVPDTPKLLPKSKCFSTGLLEQTFSFISYPNLSSVIASWGSEEHHAEAILL